MPLFQQLLNWDLQALGDPGTISGHPKCHNRIRKETGPFPILTSTLMVQEKWYHLSKFSGYCFSALLFLKCQFHLTSLTQ